MTEQTTTYADMTTLSCPYGCGAKLALDTEGGNAHCTTDGGPFGYGDECEGTGGFECADDVYNTALRVACDADRRLDDLYKASRALQKQIRLAHAVGEHAHGQVRTIAIEAYG